MTPMVAAQQQPAKEEAEEEAEEEEEDRVQCQEEGLREDEVSTEDTESLPTFRLCPWVGNTVLYSFGISEVHSLLKIYFDNE